MTFNKTIRYILPLAAAALLLPGCTGDEPYHGSKPLSDRDKDAANDVYVPQETEKTPSFKADRLGWEIDSIAPGLIYYSFDDHDAFTRRYQSVNVVELDLTRDDYGPVLSYSETPAMLSEVVRSESGVAGVNVIAETAAVNIRIDGNTLDFPFVGPIWVTEAAMCWNSNSDLRIVAGGDHAQAYYNLCTEKNLISGGRMLVADGSALPLPDDDASSHTVVAITADRDLLLVTVDAGTRYAAGMTSRQLADWLVAAFEPVSAFCLAGGDATTMVVRNHGDDASDIVNYPSSNGQSDRSGEVAAISSLVIVKK